ncbi:MAG TPA: tail fiber domain-containing protein [Phnomibacter sp.]|nr:tail fiber domain-containing protein [Phnomibacter sp.]
MILKGQQGMAQVAIGTSTLEPHTLLQLNSTTQGLLLPRLTEAQRNAIVNPADALMIYQTNNNPGTYWYHNNGGWRRLEKAPPPVWNLQGNDALVGMFVGTTTATETRLITNNSLSMRILPDGAIAAGAGTNNNSPAVARLTLRDGRGLIVRHTTAALPASPAEAPVTGAGIPMMWYGDKAAFRAGYVDAGQWNSFWTGNYSAAFGENTIASNEAGFAAGNAAFALGPASVSIGSTTQATGRGSVAMGNTTLAEGEGAVAMGRNTEARGLGSVALGYGTLAKSMGEVAVGLFNTDYTATGPNSWVATDRVFSIGNGTSATNRSNAWTVLKNGFIGMGVTNPQYRIDIPNETGVAGVARSRGWDTYSDARVKTELKPLPYGIETLLMLNPVQYLQHSSLVPQRYAMDAKGQYSIGFIAQQVAGIVPEAVVAPQHEQSGLWSLEYEKLIPVLVNAFKQQQSLIAQNEKLITEMEHSVQQKRNSHENR